MKTSFICLSTKKGYTLMEVLVSMGLSLMVITSIGTMLSSGGSLSTDNRSNLYAENALREEMEILRNTSFNTVANLNGTTFTNAQLLKLKGGSGTIGIASSYGNDIKKVTLTVSWTARGVSSSTTSQKLSTYISRIGVNGASS